jgi:Glycosyl hydrolase family 26
VAPERQIRLAMRGRRRVRLRVTMNATLVPTRGSLLGAFHKGVPSASWSRAAFSRFESLVGRSLDIDHRYHAWGRLYWPTAVDRWDVAHGRVPMASLGGASSFSTLDAITSGSEDAYISGLAHRIRAFRLPIFFRPLWEMNGDWMAWGGAANNDPGQTDGPAKYVQAWRRMHRIFARVGATNAVWVWSPNCRDEPFAPWNHWTEYYPGDAYVDWVGCDGYNRAGTRPGASWREWEMLFGGTPSIYADYPQKPFMVAETGSCDGPGDKGTWIDNARAAVEQRMGNVRAFVWFDQRKACDWRVTSSPSALAGFRRMAADPYFNPGAR